MKRFKVIYSQSNGLWSKQEVLVDTKTGINYLSIRYGGYPGGLTPLLDREGKPIVTPKYIERDDYEG